MPEMDEIGRRFMDRFVTLDGKLVLGEMQPIPETPGRGDTFFTPRRIFACAANVTLAAGSILVGPDGRKMLVADNGTAYLHAAVYKTFKLYDVDRLVTVDRVLRVVDPVSNLERDGGTSTIGPIWCAIEPDGSDNEFLKMASPRFRVLSGTALVLNDRIDGKYIVHRVDTVRGIYLSLVS